eukprot:CAMPEP_0177650462 /NCGR_PEP_ID=MMETSP0447-20121125/11957_1 /TAXON_ID=0 /ORGANISM="Stygamoeba regulata, Strain BSH-02190019" /LENGTH=477 /DNA_ID=CAMNT_0019153337 /DNA_START=177 /DNA_END=1611 /DNA_ORIENTATION=-
MDDLSELDALLGELQAPEAAAPAAVPAAATAAAPAAYLADPLDEMDALIFSLGAPTPTPAPAPTTKAPAAAKPTAADAYAAPAPTRTPAPSPSCSDRDFDDIFSSMQDGFNKVSAAGQHETCTNNEDVVCITSSRSSERDKETAMRRIVNTSVDAANRPKLAHCIVHLVDLLSTSSRPAMNHLIAQCLTNLALDDGCRAAIGKTNAIAKAVDLVRARQSDEVTEKCLSALANFMSNMTLTAGPSPALADLLVSPHPAIVTHALTCVINIAFCSDSHPSLVSAGIPQKLALLAKRPETQAHAVWSLAGLSVGNIAVQNALFHAGIVPVLVDALSSRETETVKKALSAIVNLSSVDDRMADFAASNVVARLLDVVGGGPMDVRFLALQAFQNLALDANCVHRLVQDGGVGRILSCLLSPPAKNQACALRVLTNISAVDSARKVCVDGGAIGLVESLTNSPDAEVSHQAHQALQNLRIPV